MPTLIVMPLLLPHPLPLRRFAALPHRLSRLLLLLLIILVVLLCGCRIHTSAASDHEGSYSILSDTVQAAVSTISSLSLQPPAVVERTHSTDLEAPAASAANVPDPAAADERPPGTAAGASSEGQS
jgi:hypothetical protein